MSAHLQWMIIRNNSCHLIKRNDMQFTKEQNNLRNKNSFRYNGLIHKKTVGVEADPNGKGVVLVTKKPKMVNKPGQSENRTTLTKGGRRTIRTIKRTIRKNSYRKDLRMAAIRRACAIMKSQKAAK
uniref:60S ribosomal protein L28-like n=1 Tax=Ciona intestinalis TaxID=7719 RepID=UPI000180BA60|nr:60S ribosomal protein L28-like [Ciona intestinalis]XP_002130793.1 60S ribosomal protein L28-like [Ciona intestinalis]|eukprot:XP_002130777.1 60S ribosomal protein L28-like [Ciona intestinalis]